MSEEEYVVEKIIGKRTRGNTVEYKIKWEGYSEEECTWEPFKNLKHLEDMIEEYERIESIKSNIKNKETTKPENKEKPTIQAIKPEHECERRESIDADMVPEKVLTVKEFNAKLYALVEWSESSDGTLPDSCFVPSDLLTDTHPKVLIAFYETKIKFVKKK
jgi:hypothetical protein